MKIELSLLSKLLNKADASDFADIREQMKGLEIKILPLKVKDYFDEKIYGVKTFFDTKNFLLKNYRTHPTDSVLRLFKLHKQNSKKDSYTHALNAYIPEECFKGSCYHLEECFKHITNTYVKQTYSF